MCSGDEERQEHGHHVLLAQTFFPSSICAIVLPIIHLLEDGEVSDDGVAGKLNFHICVTIHIIIIKNILQEFNKVIQLKCKTLGEKMRQ